MRYQLFAAVMSGAVALWADAPYKPAQATKPQWQRMLEGDDARKAADLEKRVEEHFTKNHLGEAAAVARELARFRADKQGADHWESADARWQAAAVTALSRAGLADEWKSAQAADADADALERRGRYREAQPLKEKSH